MPAVNISKNQPRKAKGLGRPLGQKMLHLILALFFKCALKVHLLNIKSIEKEKVQYICIQVKIVGYHLKYCEDDNQPHCLGCF